MFSFDLTLLSFGPVVVAKTDVVGLFLMSDILTDKIFFLVRKCYQAWKLGRLNFSEIVCSCIDWQNE